MNREEMVAILTRCTVIVVYNTKSFLHKIIAVITRKPFTPKAGHVALYLEETDVAEAIARGVVLRKVKGFNAKKYNIYLARYRDLDESTCNKIIEAAVTMVGTPYSYWQLPLLWFKYFFKLKSIPDASKKAVICSEFISKCFKEADIDLFGKDCEEAVPVDYLDKTKFIVTKVA